MRHPGQKHPQHMWHLARAVISKKLDVESAARRYGCCVATAQRYVAAYRKKMSDADAICLVVKAEMRNKRARADAI